MADFPDTLGPYRLEKLLGSGGMGEVYRAYDRRLHRRVAIKHFRSDSSDGAASRDRFLREARSAASLSHPAIVQIHDILEDEAGDWDGDWIVMELVDGPTVAELVADGRLPVERAVTLARQVAEGLAEAHDQGVLHRDLKSENVMLARENRAKILDFGLAKRLWPSEGELTLSMDGRVLGTCRTMSPEQARGQKLDARSDLFSLGVLLYEMLTGESPFYEETHVDTLARVCHHEPEPVSGLNPEVPQELSGLVAWLLEKDRDRRPGSAREVAEILTGMDATVSRSGSAAASGWSGAGAPITGETLVELPRVASSGDSRTSGKTGARWTLGSLGLDPPYRPSLRHPVALGVAVAVALAVGAMGWGLRTAVAPAEIAETAEVATAGDSISVRPSVAVLGFRNLSQREEEAWMSTGFAEMLSAELAAGEQLRTVAGETVARAKRELALPEGETLGEETLSKVRAVAGADLVVLGSYLAVPGVDGDLRLVLNVQDTAAGQTVLTVRETASRREILDLVSRVGGRLRNELGAGTVSAAATRAARATRPESPEALELYSEGLRQMRAYELVRARDLLQRAVAAESDFPLAHSALAEAWSALGYDAKAQEQAAKAVELAEDLPREDRQLIEARHHEMSWRWDEAIESYRTLWEFFPDNVEYGLRLAGALTTAGRGREALEVVAAMRELPAPASEDVRIDLAEAEALRWLSEYRRALTVARRAVEHGAEQGARLLEAEAQVLEASSALHLDAPKQARASLEAARRLYAEAGDRRGEAWTLSRQGDLASLLGDLDRALTMRSTALKQLREVGDQEGLAKLLNNFGSDLMSADRLAEAAPKLQEAVQTAQKIENRRLEGAFRVTLGLLAYRRGDLEAGEQEASQALEVVEGFGFGYSSSAARWVLGEVWLAQGKLEQARTSLEVGLEQAREGDPILLPLLLSSLGDLEVAAGNLEAAQKLYQEALELRRNAWNSQIAAQSRLALAELALEKGNPRKALTDARVVLPSLARTGKDKEAQAVAVITSALVALNQVEELEVQLADLEHLLSKCQTVPTRLDAAIQLARGRAAVGARDEAIRTVQAVQTESHWRGFRLLEMEARLVLAELRKAGGEPTAAQELRTLAREARKKRFLLLAQKAGSNAGR